jgi:hypothetical protein
MEKNDEPNQQPSLDNRIAYSPGEFAALFGKHQTWGYRQLYKGVQSRRLLNAGGS